MISWAISHREAIGWLALGIYLGIFFAAWRQLKLEDERWIRRMRSNVGGAIGRPR